MKNGEMAGEERGHILYIWGGDNRHGESASEGFVPCAPVSLPHPFHGDALAVFPAVKHYGDIYPSAASLAWGFGAAFGDCALTGFSYRFLSNRAHWVVVTIFRFPAAKLGTFFRSRNLSCQILTLKTIITENISYESLYKKRAAHASRTGGPKIDF